MEIHCLFCHKTVDQTPGKRQKNFCNTSCRSMYWQQNKRVPKTVQRVTYDKVVAENNALREEVSHLAANYENLQTAYEELQVRYGKLEAEFADFVAGKGAPVVPTAPAAIKEKAPAKIKEPALKKHLSYEGYEERIGKLVKPSAEDKTMLKEEINGAPGISAFERRVLISALEIKD